MAAGTPLGGVASRDAAVPDTKRPCAASQQLLAAQELARAIVRSSQGGIVAFDLERRFTLWNAAMERLYEIEACDVIGRTLAELSPRSLVRGLDDSYRAALSGETVQMNRRTIVGRRSGRQSLVNVSYTPLCDDGGRIIGGVGMFRDVTEELRDQLQLERLSAVVEQTEEGVIMTDASGRFTWANPAWERITGWPIDEVVGQFPGDFLRGVDSDPAAADRITQAVLAGAGFNEEMLNYRRDGTPFWVSIRATPIKNADGVLTGYVAIEHDSTMQRELERTLRAERAFATSLVAANSDGIFAVDRGFRVTDWNPALERWTGLARADVVGQTLDTVVPLADNDARRKRFDQMLTDGKPFSQERTYRFAATELEVQSVVSPIRDLVTGEISGALCTIRDVSERRAAAERFRVLFEQSSDGYFIVEGNRIVDCNGAALRLLRAADKQSILGLHPAQLSPEYQPDGGLSQTLERSWIALALQEGHCRFDWVHRRLDGTEVSVEVSLTAVTLEGRPVLLVVLHDLTTRLEAGAAVRRERERLLDAIGALDAGFAMFDADERLVAFNERFRGSPVGHRPGLQVGMSLDAILEAVLVEGKYPGTGHDGARWKDDILSRHRGNGGVSEEVGPHGSMRVSVSRTSDGGSVGLFTDISELKRIQHSLEQARDAATDASRAKSDFLARMSHELRTPLNSIIGFSRQVLKELNGPLHPKDHEYLDRVLRNGTELLSLINDILDLSKIEAGRVEIHRTPTDLRDVVAETLAMLEGQPRPAALQLVADVPPTLATVDTDEALLRQVLINLVGNALKFTKCGIVRVQVDSDADHLPRAISVTDTGIGIPADRLEAVFGAFEQANTTTSRAFGGTGLGLAISRSLCELLGLTLSVESEVGVGTSFRITFPLVSRDVTA